MAIDLDKKIGPLKLKTWTIVGAGTFGLVWYATRRSAHVTDNAEEVPPIEDVGQNMPDTGYFPTTGGGGGYSGFDSTVDLAPLSDQLVDFSGQLEDIRGQLGTIAEQTAPVPPAEEVPGGGPEGDPFGERLARLIARRKKLQAARQSAESGAERRRVSRRVQRTNRTIRRVRARRRAARNQ